MSLLHEQGIAKQAFPLRGRPSYEGTENKTDGIIARSIQNLSTVPLSVSPLNQKDAALQDCEYPQSI